MAENFLSQLTPEWLASVIGGGAMPAPIAQPSPVMSIQAAQMPAPAPVNLLEGIPNVAPVERQPRERRSILDTIGRAADVFARVGGAEALYQPTLDARQDRAFAIEDRTRAIDLDGMRKQMLQQQIEGGEDEATARQNALLGNAVRGLQAVVSRGGNLQAAWPLLAQQAGIDADRAAQLGEIFTSNPDVLPAFASMLGQQREYGLQPFYAKDANGNLQAYQLGKDGTVAPVTLPAGAEPIDPFKAVNLGDRTALVGTRSGDVQRTLAQGEAPGRAADRENRLRIAREGNRTRVNLADRNNRARADLADKKAGSNTETGGGAMASRAAGLLSELDGIYDAMKRDGSIVNQDQSALGNIAARVRSSGAGQLAEGAVGTAAQAQRDRVNSIRPALMQSIAKATGMSGKQLDSNADVKLFMQTVTNPTASYEANKAAIRALRGFLAANAQKPAAGSSQRAPQRAPQRSTPAPRRDVKKPSVSNW